MKLNRSFRYVWVVLVLAAVASACGNIAPLPISIGQIHSLGPAASTVTPTPTFFSPNTHTPVSTITPTTTGTPLPTGTPVPTITPITPLSLGTPFPTDGAEVINVLLLGADYSSSNFSRTDVMIIASIRPGDRMVTLISIPRDLYVSVPGRGMQRINTAYLYGELDGYPGGGEALTL